MFHQRSEFESRVRFSFSMTNLFFLLCLVSVSLIPTLGYPQEKNGNGYPNHPITFVIPIPAGGSADLSLRLIAKSAEKFLGQPVVPLNKPGGSHTIGIATIAASKPDGYTIGYTSFIGLFLAPMIDKAPYHPVKDLTQIMQFGCVNIGAMVKQDSPFKSWKDVVAFAHENPNKLTYGTTGQASIPHLAMEEIAKKEGLRFTHIPFRGAPEVQTALLGGHILVGAGDFNYSLVESGQMRLLFLIAEKRLSEYPETPILKDLGYDFPATVLLNVAGPKGLPKEIAGKLEDAFTRATYEPMFLKGMKDLRLTVFHRNSKELADYVVQNYEVFGKLLRDRKDNN